MKNLSKNFRIMTWATGWAIFLSIETATDQIQGLIIQGLFQIFENRGRNWVLS